ncbi:hypothetical protein CR513_26358, partial [Mucuna pruriens]
MEESSQEWGNLSPKSWYILDVMREFRKKLDQVGKGLNLVQKDTQSVIAKVEDLSKGKKDRPKVASIHESEGNFEEGNYSKGSMTSWYSLGERHERQVRVERNRRKERRERHGRRGEEQRREELDMSKCKILPFLGNCKLEKLKYEQTLGCFNLYRRVVVRLITLEFGDYALVWWTQMFEDIRRGIKDPCEDWVALSRMMRDRFALPSYTKDLHNKLQRLYQGSMSVEEYHKEMEMD